MIAAGIGAAGSLASGLFSSNASSKAADTQAQASANSLALQSQMFAKSQGNIAPYLATGANASNMLTNTLGNMQPITTSPIKMDQASLEQTPGYQFNLSQGLKGVQNSASARGLGVSGAAQKGAAAYATGLADSTYQNQFNNAVTNQQNAFNNQQTDRQNMFNRLYSTAALGANAAGGAATNATTAGNSMANTTMTGANGQAAAQVAGGTAFNPLLNNLGGYYQMSQMGGMYGGGGLGTSGLTGAFNGG